MVTLSKAWSRLTRQEKGLRRNKISFPTPNPISWLVTLSTSPLVLLFYLPKDFFKFNDPTSLLQHSTGIFCPNLLKDLPANCKPVRLKQNVFQGWQPKLSRYMIQVNSNSICLTGWVAWFGGGGTLLINASYIDSNGRSSSTWSNEETDLKIVTMRKRKCTFHGKLLSNSCPSNWKKKQIN